eukprot:3159825-Prymnesium_polylepis.1
MSIENGAAICFCVCACVSLKCPGQSGLKNERVADRFFRQALGTRHRQRRHMPDRRVGTVDNPGSARQISVYENSKGYYIKLDGLREKLHGNMRWTTTSGVEMKGRTQHVQQPPAAWSEDAWEDDDLAIAIAASLADAAPAGYEPAGPMEEESAD